MCGFNISKYYVLCVVLLFVWVVGDMEGKNESGPIGKIRFLVLGTIVLKLKNNNNTSNEPFISAVIIYILKASSGDVVVSCSVLFPLYNLFCCIYIFPEDDDEITVCTHVYKLIWFCVFVCIVCFIYIHIFYSSFPCSSVIFNITL